MKPHSSLMIVPVAEPHVFRNIHEFHWDLVGNALLDLRHEIRKGHRTAQRNVLTWIGKGMNVPATGVVCSEDTTVLVNEGKGCRARLLVVENIDEAACGDTNTQTDGSSS